MELCSCKVRLSTLNFSVVHANSFLLLLGFFSDCTSTSWLAVGDFSSGSRVVGQGSRTLDGGSGGQGTTTTAKLLLSFFLLLLPC